MKDKYPQYIQLCRTGDERLTGGDLAGAERSYRDAIRSAPDAALGHQRLGEILLRTADYVDAINALEHAIGLDPLSVSAWYSLGSAYRLSGQGPEAETALLKVLDLAPGQTQARVDLADLWLKQDRARDALACLERGLRAAPEDILLLSRQGIALIALQRYREACEVLAPLADRDRPELKIGFHLGLAYLRLDQDESAIEAFGRAIECDPGHCQAYFRMTEALMGLGRIDEAFTCLDQAMRIDACVARAHSKRGNLYRAQGDFVRAAEDYSSALRIDPLQASAYAGLSRIKTYRDPAELSPMIALVRREDISDEQRLHVLFALAKAYEDLGEIERAFDYYRDGNQLYRRHFPYRVEQDIAAFDRLVEIFTPDFFARFSSEHQEAKPIFIVGMPRSGTTLTEQILASHPDVCSGSELPYITHIVRQLYFRYPDRPLQYNIEQIDQVSIQRAREYYMEGLSKISPAAIHVTDKMPYNFAHLAVIRLLFPQAAVVHCVRDPIDNCLSCYRQYFETGHLYMYDLADLGHYYAAYQRLMAHWKSVMPGYIHDLHYEALITDPRGQVAELLDFCRLPWDEGCLNFHTREGHVRTASVAQVRRPIYRDSVERWRRFEPYLGPLIEALQSDAR